jgi:hypothetical protein
MNADMFQGFAASQWAAMDLHFSGINRSRF